MRILWFTWKDKTNPKAGGAEVTNEEIAKRIILDGHEVVFLVGGYPGCVREEIIDGYKVIRLGNQWTVYLVALMEYRKNWRDWPDLIIEEINTIPFFTQFYSNQRRVLIFYQLCREIWFYQMGFPLNIIGYLIEPIYLNFLKSNKIITISESSKRDLVKFGFSEEKIEILSLGIDITHLEKIDDDLKYSRITLLSLGSIRPMKRTLDQIKAFEKIKPNFINAQLLVVGDASGQYGDKVIRYCNSSKYSNDIKIIGRVSRDRKREIMRKSHLLLMTSVKEGWGLTVSEAASQGTPTVAYDVDGLRDSCFYGKVGYLVKEDIQSLSDGLNKVLSDKETYKKLQNFGLKHSRSLKFEKTSQQFIDFIS